MKVAAYAQPGPPEVLVYQDAPAPVPGEREILIRVEAITIEGGDAFGRRYIPAMGGPHVPGYQAAGTVIALGAGATRFRVGDRVATYNDQGGSHAEQRAVPEDLAWPVPDDLAIELGACVPVIFSTTDDGLFAIGRLQAGETVLIQGASGGVGIAAVQLARAAGATVIGTSSSDDSLAKLRELGMHHGINHRTENVAERVRELTGGRGADLVFDNAGGKGFEALIEATAQRGRIVSVGAASGEFATVSTMVLIMKELTVSGFIMRHHLPTERCREMIAGHMAKMASGEWKLPIAHRFLLSEAAAAHTMVEQGHPFGRVVMIP